jgi:uncharacterized protein (DUF927 family)
MGASVMQKGQAISKITIETGVGRVVAEKQMQLLHDQGIITLIKDPFLSKYEISDDDVNKVIEHIKAIKEQASHQ